MSIESVAQYFLSPLVLSLLLDAVAVVCAGARQARAARALAAAAFLLLWVCSTPWLAYEMHDSLALRYPPFAARDAPAADAIVVLGGAVAGARVPERPSLSLGTASTRVWYAAALFRSGKAARILVAAGNKPEQVHEQVEADAVAEVLVQLGVPASALVLERGSRTTRENAANSLPLLDQMGARRILLVTSADHMPRAVATFAHVWGGRGPEVVPAPVDGPLRPALNPLELWLPSLPALLVVTSSLKEFAGMAGLAIIQ